VLILVLGIGSVEVGERQAFYCWLRRIHISETGRPLDGWMDGWMNSWILMLLLKFHKYSFSIFYRIIYSEQWGLDG